MANGDTRRTVFRYMLHHRPLVGLIVGGVILLGMLLVSVLNQNPGADKCFEYVSNYPICTDQVTGRQYWKNGEPPVQRR